MCEGGKSKPCQQTNHTIVMVGLNEIRITLHEIGRANPKYEMRITIDLWQTTNQESTS